MTFWNELAHIAFQHVEKGQQIYISGRLVSDTVESEDGRQQTYYKVFSIYFILITKGHSLFTFSLALVNYDSFICFAGSCSTT